MKKKIVAIFSPEKGSKLSCEPFSSLPKKNNITFFAP